MKHEGIEDLSEKFVFHTHLKFRAGFEKISNQLFGAVVDSIQTFRSAAVRGGKNFPASRQPLYGFILWSHSRNVSLGILCCDLTFGIFPDGC